MQNMAYYETKTNICRCDELITNIYIILVLIHYPQVPNFYKGCMTMDVGKYFYGETTTENKMRSVMVVPIREGDLAYKTLRR
jgi:hypothetical protein